MFNMSLLAFGKKFNANLVATRPDKTRKALNYNDLQGSLLVRNAVLFVLGL